MGTETTRHWLAVRDHLGVAAGGHSGGDPLSSMSRFHRRGNGTSVLVGGVVVSVHGIPGIGTGPVAKLPE